MERTSSIMDSHTEWDLHGIYGQLEFIWNSQFTVSSILEYTMRLPGSIEMWLWLLTMLTYRVCHNVFVFGINSLYSLVMHLNCYALAYIFCIHQIALISWLENIPKPLTLGLKFEKNLSFNLFAFHGVEGRGERYAECINIHTRFYYDP